MRRVLPLIVLSSLAFAPVPKRSTSEIDLGKLQGHWDMTKGTFSGSALAAGDITGIRIDGGRLEITGRDSRTWAVTLDARKSPKQFKAVTFAGQPGEMNLSGTYVLSGDTLTLSYRLHSPLLIQQDVPEVDAYTGTVLTLKRRKH
jgi:uncharacterized protein (TIGR03067 family)